MIDKYCASELADFNNLYDFFRTVRQFDTPERMQIAKEVFDKILNNEMLSKDEMMKHNISRILKHINSSELNNRIDKVIDLFAKSNFDAKLSDCLAELDENNINVLFDLADLKINNPDNKMIQRIPIYKCMRDIRNVETAQARIKFLNKIIDAAKTNETLNDSYFIGELVAEVKDFNIELIEKLYFENIETLDKDDALQMVQKLTKNLCEYLKTKDLNSIQRKIKAQKEKVLAKPNLYVNGEFATQEEANQEIKLFFRKMQVA